MKSLLLLRHAKSSWDDPALADARRPLAARGLRDAPAMGRLMAERGWLPQRVLVSPATRTRQTWALVADALPAAPPATYPEALYMAGPDELLAQIRNTPQGIETLLLVGHNPGLEELAAALAGEGSDAGALARMKAKFPTAALARLEFAGAWEELGKGRARLGGFERPGEA